MVIHNKLKISSRNRHITTKLEKLILNDGKVDNVVHDAADVLGTRGRCEANAMVYEEFVYLY